MQSYSFALVLLVAAAPSLIDARRMKRVSPKVSSSDEKFMGNDLPADKRPSATNPKLAFGHPYPAVQEHADYENDFVKDTNKDNGEWKTQSEYDLMRSKVRQEEKEMMEAEAKMNMEKKELEKAKEHAGHAKGEAKDAKAKEDSAAAKTQDAEKERSAAEKAEAEKK